MSCVSARGQARSERSRHGRGLHGRSFPGHWFYGQALVETLVSVLFLVPIFLSAVYLVDFHRASHASEIAARELALTSLHSADGNVEQSILRSIRDLSLPASERAGAPSPAGLEHVDTQNVASEVERAANLLLAPARFSGSGTFDVPRWQQRRVSSGVSMGSTTLIGVPFEIPIELNSKLVFFSGHGAASGVAQVRVRTAALSVAGTLKAAASPIEAVATVASIIEPALRQLCIGRINPEIVPADRLPDSVSRHNDMRSQPC
jgi:hypothetical protein